MPMDRFESMRALVLAVDEGSFAAAGRKLGLTRVQVSRLVGALEDHIGAPLLKRTTRTMALTEAGMVFVEQARTLVAQMDEAEAAVGHIRGELEGLLRVSAPTSLGGGVIATAMADFMAQHPSVSAALVLNDRHVDLREEGFDVMVRIGEPPPSTLVVRPLCPVRQLMCASPDYLETRGRPRTPAELASHALLHLGNLGSPMNWPVRGVEGNAGLAVTPVLSSNNADVLRAAALAGRGITLLPAHTVSSELADGSLVAILDGFEPKPETLVALYQADGYRPAKARAFVEFLAARFKRRPPGGPA